MPVEAVRAEADTGSADTVSVPFGDTTLDVQVAGKWRKSALNALRQGDFDTWAQKCLTPDSLAVWDEADPTMDEIQELFASYRDVTGQDPGKLLASPGSSRSTARR